MSPVSRCWVQPLLLLPLLAVLGACSSLSSMQTARPLPEGTFRLGLAGGLAGSPSLNPSHPQTLNYPYLEGSGRFGFTPGWDLGLRVSTPGMVNADVKAAVWDEGPWAMAVGFGVGYLGVVNLSDESATVFKQDVLDIVLPVYFSVDLSEIWGITLSPRWILRDAEARQSLIAAALGIRWGNRQGVFVEISAAQDTLSDFAQGQVGIGFFWGDAPSVSSSPARVEGVEY